MKTVENSNSLFNLAIAKWGKPLQKGMAIEEMSELTKELCKSLRGIGDVNKIEEEIADVIIMIAQLKKMYSTVSINDWINIKLTRVEKILKGVK